MSKKVSTKTDEDIRSAENINEAVDIKNFITSISTKKYALAHKYLKQVIEDKVKARISSSLNEPLF